MISREEIIDYLSKAGLDEFGNYIDREQALDILEEGIGLSPEEFASIHDLSHMALATAITKSKKYGNIWKNTDLRPPEKSMMAEISAKYNRLKQMIWETPEEDYDAEHALHICLDTANYLLFIAHCLKMRGINTERLARAMKDEDHYQED